MKTWRDIEELSDRGKLVSMIEEYGTPTRIARAVGCTASSVKNAMKFHGLVSKKYRIGDSERKRLKL